MKPYPWYMPVIASAAIWLAIGIGASLALIGVAHFLADRFPVFEEKAPVKAPEIPEIFLELQSPSAVSEDYRALWTGETIYVRRGDAWVKFCPCPEPPK